MQTNLKLPTVQEATNALNEHMQLIHAQEGNNYNYADMSNTFLAGMDFVLTHIISQFKVKLDEQSVAGNSQS